jgi:hypothetical protein
LKCAIYEVRYPSYSQIDCRKAVGTAALIFPAEQMSSKGTVVANLRMHEVGILLVSIGIMAWWIREHADSSTIKAFLFGNLLI